MSLSTDIIPPSTRPQARRNTFLSSASAERRFYCTLGIPPYLYPLVVEHGEKSPCSLSRQG